MKHLWFGAGLLAALLVLGLWVGPRIEQSHHIPAKDLDKAVDAVLEDNWPLAEALFTRASRHWQSHRNLSASLARHDPMEQIDRDFAAAGVYLRIREKTAFCALCAQLAQSLRSLPQAHTPHWWNFL